MTTTRQPSDTPSPESGVPTGGHGRPTTDIDILDKQLYADDPFPAYRWLRENAPVCWDERNGLWVVSTYAEVVHVSQHPELFCSGKGVRPEQPFALSLIGLDEPRHTQQRRLINKGFTPRAVRTLAGRVQQVTDEIIDSVAGRSECDFVTDIAIHVPLVMIAELMGLPAVDRLRLWKWSDRMMAGDGCTDPADPKLVDAAAAFGEYVEYTSALVDEARARVRAHKAAVEAGREAGPLPTDLITTLVRGHEEGLMVSDAELTRDELTMFLALVVVAGNETTRNAMSGSMRLLSENPDVWRQLVADPSLFDTATDEMIRLVSPVLSFVRTATRDTVLGGQTIAAGERVLLLYQSANRDASRFERPDDFVVDRDPTLHVAFGTGPHFCLGVHLARLEVRTLFETLARRLPDIRVAPGEGATYTPHNLIHTIERLPVVFTPES